MPGFAGFDISTFPGHAQMAWMKQNTNLVWCGYYLAPAPSHGNTSWMGSRGDLLGMGWGLAPVYVGQQISGPQSSHNLSDAQGSTDGHATVALMVQDGWDPGSCVFLDLEDGPPLVSPRSDYVAAWVEAVTTGGYQPGVYCSHGIAATVAQLCPAARIWAFKVPTTQQTNYNGTTFPTSDPSGCGYPAALAWQLQQNCRLTLPGAPMPNPVVDLDTATTPDPSSALIA